MYKIEITNRFRQSIKKAKKDGYNLKLLENVIDILSKGEILP